MAIYDVLREEYLRFPDSEEKWERISDLIREKWQFPNCIGAMDGKHIDINFPPSSSSTYWNYKAFYSIVLLAFVDASYKFTYNNVGCLGRISDGGVLRASDLYEIIVSGTLNPPPPNPLLIKDPQWNVVGETQQPLPYMIVGDEAFPLKEEIMKPYARKQLDDATRIFNYCLPRIRRVSENAFGILSSRFRILHTIINLNPEKVMHVVMAICVLHSFLLHSSNDSYCPAVLADQILSSHQIYEGQWRENGDSLTPLAPVRPAKPPLKAIEIRERLKEYFIGPGQVEWQGML